MKTLLLLFFMKRIPMNQQSWKLKKNRGQLLQLDRKIFKMKMKENIGFIGREIF